MSDENMPAITPPAAESQSEDDVASAEFCGSEPVVRAPELRPLVVRPAFEYGDAHLVNGRGVIITQEDPIGRDDREQVHPTSVWPYRATGQIIVKFPNGQRCIGTGCLIGKRHVLTAAHNLFEPSMGGRAVRADFIPARDGETAPYGESLAVKIWYPLAYEQGDARADYALLWLASDVGEQVGYYKVQPHAPAELVNQEVSIAGYAVDKPGSGKNLWGARNAVAYADEDFLHYIVDTGGGQSGSGIFLKDTASGTQHLVGIHTEACGSYNRGVRVSSTLFRECFGRIARDP